MFLDIKCINYYYNNKIFKIEDTDFIETVALKIEASEAYHYVGQELAIFSIYQGKGLPIPINLARMYHKLRIANFDYALNNYAATILDKYYPELEYSEKYYPCVKRQIKQLDFAKNNH